MAFDTFTDNIKMAAPIPELGINEGDTFQSALEKFAVIITDIRTLLNNEVYPGAPAMSTDQIKHDDDTLLSPDGLSPDAAQFDGKKIKIESVRHDETVDITFKTTDFDIPAGSTLASSIVNISGQRNMGRTEITNTKERELVVNVAYNRFPVTLDARVVYTTATGDVELRKSIVINSDKDFSQETPYEVIDRTTNSKPTYLKDTLRQMSGRIKSLESGK